ncbi:DUF6454 family protein [Polycladomyces subterraneus]|uniref:DUF6454 family protein n=1 Tax=Polycladomyces subterraneus TaxID=1016997 RepID=A0ABT8IRK8_9BACL|nr:DUF6454 family protein [Polycladomyces subterraneus]MDN4595418.1 DUF6454 family protein [Polycladomyces subterraneus]
MRKIVFIVTVIFLIGTVFTAVTMAQPDHAETKDALLPDKFQQLSRSTKWQQIEKIDLPFNVYHPQGMTRIGDLYYMSSVEIIEKPVKYDQPRDGYDRTPGKGVGHLFAFDKQGKLVKDIQLGEGIIYHPGGIAYDGKYIWVPVAEYRPNSHSIIYKVDPKTMKAEEVFRVNDHIGGLVHDVRNGKLIGVSWGSRKFYLWNEQGKQLRVENNPSHFVDYQDCEGVGQGKIVCSGISELPNPATNNSNPYELGGLALLDTNTLDILHEVPVTEFSPQGHVITRNPVYLENTDQGLRLYAVPDDDHASLLVYEAN